MKTLMITSIEDTDAENSICEIFREAGIEVSVIRIADQEIRGCTGCGKCYRRRQCIFNDSVNEAISEAETADGLFILCGAVYSDVDESVHRFMKRLFNCASDMFSSKPAACAVISSSQKHCSEKLYRYFEQGNMPVVTTYTSNCIADASDESLRIITDHFIWLLKCIAHAEEDESDARPEKAQRTFRFIR